MPRLLLLVLVVFSVSLEPTLGQTPVYVAAPQPSSDTHHMTQFMEYDGQVFFVVDAGSSKQLWKTDGSPENTSMVLSSNALNILAVHDDRLYLAIYHAELGSQLHISDGTAEGTRVLTDVKPPLGFVGGLGVGTTLGDLFLFIGNDTGMWDTDGYGREWWVSDGTPEGTRLLKDINPGHEGQKCGDMRVVFDGKLFFYGYTEGMYCQLWMTDGTPDGTIMLTPGSNYPATVLHNYDMIVYDDVLYFTYHDWEHGVELWTTDGTVEGTGLFMDLNAQVTDLGPRHGSPSYFNIHNGRLLFTAYVTGGSTHLWSSDGTPEHTTPITQLSVSALSPMRHTNFDGKLYFSAVDTESSNSSHGHELWVTDGTAAGTGMLKDVNPGPGSSSIRHITVAGDRLFFYANHPDHGFELWTSDGSESGTRIVSDISPGSDSANIRGLYVRDDEVYFVARIGANDYHLFASDGTESGTRRLAPENANVETSPLSVKGFGINRSPVTMWQAPGGSLFFQARFTDEGHALYRLGEPVATFILNESEGWGDFGLEQNYPNPFNPTTTIQYALPEAVHVRVSVFNLLGQEVARLVDQPHQAGSHKLQWNASDLPSGTYVYVIEAGSFRESRRMVLVK